MRFLAVVLGFLCAFGTAAVILIARTGSISSILHSASPAATVSAASAESAQASPGESQPASRDDRLADVGIVTNSLKDFQKVTSAYPSLTVNYLNWGSPFPTDTVLSNRRLGAKTLIVLEPERVSLPGIASGREDRYLENFAAAERKAGLPVLLSFGPEANGNWYPWGAHRITPALYVAMWHRVHDVIMRNGGTRITWVWQMNTPWPQSEPMSLLWPGKAYVDEVGLDSQMRSPGETFSDVFGPSLSQVRAITNKPILIGEVSVKVGAGMPAEIKSLFDGACQDHLIAVILFDIHSEWQFDNDAQAVAAYRKAATSPCHA